MSSSIYNIADGTTTFFELRKPLTRVDCDKHASVILASSVLPVDIQGQFSYTVGRADGTGAILQYRDVSSTMNLHMIEQAQQAHGDLVPGVEQLPMLQNGSSALNVYKLERKLGVLYIMNIIEYCSSIDSVQEVRLEATIRSMARFFAQSWKHPQSLTITETAAHHKATSMKLELLSQTLPAYFQEHIARLQRDLPLLYEDYPFVLSQGDMISTNLIVSSETGSLVGVLDWEEASKQPFGFELYALEEASGNMDGTGWRYFRGDRWAHSRFWDEFWSTQGKWSPEELQKLQVSRDVGIYLRYGFKWVNDDFIPINETDRNKLTYLKAFTKESFQL